MDHLKAIASAQKKEKLSLLLIALVIGSAIIGQAYLLVTIVDMIFLQQQSMTAILPLLGGLLLLLLIRTGFNYLSGKIGIQLAAKVKAHFRKALLKKFTTNPLLVALRGQTGEKVSVLMDAVDEVDGYYSKYIPQMMQTSIIPLIVLVAVFTQHMTSGMIMLVTAPFFPIYMIVVGIQTKQKSEEQMDQLAAFSGRFLDTLQGLVTLKLFGQANRQKEAIKQSSLGFRDATMDILKTAFTSSFMLEVVTMLSIGVIALELAIRLMIYQNMDFFTAFFILMLAPEFYNSLKRLGSTFHNGQTSIGAAKKVTAELSEEDHKVVWGEQSLIKRDTPPRLKLEDVGFHYGEEDQFALKHIDVDIPPYSQVAIVGRSGSGKTTLLQLIAGILPPSEGRLLINDQSMSSYQEGDWFDQLSYISQHPYIFSGSIGENIAIGSKVAATSQQIKEAAEQAGIAQLIESLEHGYDTPVGEAGRGLSGGEKQRLAMARAFLKKPAIILFDEPTVGLDLQTEQALQASIKQLARHSTVITVAHRLHTIKHADRILFVDKGRLVASGTHDELIQSVAAYRDMVLTQQGGEA